MNINKHYDSVNGKVVKPKTVEVLIDKTRQVYNTPDKGILWGWEVSAYVWTKAISAGIFLLCFLGWVTGLIDIDSNMIWWAIGIGLIFLALTGILLVKDLDRPDRFLYVLLRPHWNSWLVRGGYAIAVYGGFLTLLVLAKYFNWEAIVGPLMYVTAISACIVAIYTAFLFAQASGRDFWQSPGLAIHMLVHSFMAGAAATLLISLFRFIDEGLMNFSVKILLISIIVNLTVLMIELITTHPTNDAKLTVNMILKGRYKSLFWLGVIIVGKHHSSIIYHYRYDYGNIWNCNGYFGIARYIY